MFIRTERLLLRPGWIEDAADVAAAIDDEAILTKLARVPSPYHVSDARYFLSQPATPPHIPLLIFRRTQGAPQLIGCTGLADHNGEAELGYWLAREAWGQGYATEAGRAVVEMARHSARLPRLVSGHFVDNPASGKVLVKLGFRPTGETEMRECVARGIEVPCRLFTLDLWAGAENDQAERAVAA